MESQYELSRNTKKVLHGRKNIIFSKQYKDNKKKDCLINIKKGALARFDI